MSVALGIRAGYFDDQSGATEMTKALASAWAEVTIPQKVGTYITPSVLLIADFGITPFDRTEANVFIEVVNRCHELRSATVVTTNRGQPKARLSSSEGTPSSPRPSWGRLLERADGHQHQGDVVTPT